MLDHFVETQIYPRYTYPRWIKFGAILSLCLFCASLAQIPHYININKKLNKGNDAFKTRNFTLAAKKYQKLLAIIPDNKWIKIQIAKTLFSSENEMDHYFAMAYLEDLSFDSGEWRSLSRYIPEEYIDCFIEEKRKR